MKHLIAYPEILYADGGYYDGEVPIEACFVLNNLDQPPVAFFDHVFDSAICNRSSYSFFGSSDDFKQELSANYEFIRKEFSVSPACVAYSIKNCYVFKNVIYRSALEGLDVIHETYRNNDRPWTEALPFDAPPPPASRRFESVDGNCIYMGSVGSSNYGHWLVDDLARLKFLADKKGSYTLVLTAMGEAIDRIRSQSIDLMLGHLKGGELKYEIVYTQPSDVLHFEDLIYITPVSFHPFVKHPSAENFVRANILSALSNPGSGEARLFVKRSQSRYRKLINIEEIEAILEANGFTAIDPEQFDFQTQVKKFAEASIVVGIMGAAMTNTIFCAPGTEVIYLAPDRWMEPFYWDLAGVMGHRYSTVFGDLSGAHDMPYFDDFSIAEDDLRAALNQLGEIGSGLSMRPRFTTAT